MASWEPRIRHWYASDMCGYMSNASAKYEDNKREAATGNRSPRRHQLEAPSEEGAGRQ